jgi:hypothetical protein
MNGRSPAGMCYRSPQLAGRRVLRSSKQTYGLIGVPSIEGRFLGAARGAKRKATGLGPSCVHLRGRTSEALTP